MSHLVIRVPPVISGAVRVNRQVECAGHTQKQKELKQR